MNLHDPPTSLYNPSMDEQTARKKFDEVINTVTTDIGSIRTGRATPGLVEDIVVPAYGGQSHLKVQELATISAQDTHTLIIDPYDKSIIGDIRKGIEAANIGVNPAIDGEIIRISLPQMTTEDREKFVKLLGQKIESGKVMVRQVRAEEMKEIKEAFENKELSEDDKHLKEENIQKIVDEYTGKLDELQDKKEKELMQI